MIDLNDFQFAPPDAPLDEKIKRNRKFPQKPLSSPLALAIKRTQCELFFNQPKNNVTISGNLNAPKLPDGPDIPS